MMKKFSFFFLLIMISAPVFSQEVGNKANEYYALNTFFVEGVGRAENFSLNYERRFMLDENKAISAHIGAGPDVGALRVPITVNFLKGSRPHYMVLGLGQTLFFQNELNNTKFIYHKLNYSQESSAWHLNIGYRYQAPTGGLFLQAAFTPLFWTDEGPGPEILGLYPWGGVSIGYSLKNVNVK